MNDKQPSEYIIKSVAEFTKTIAEIRQKTPLALWLYRGVADSDWGLKTSAERRIKDSNPVLLVKYLQDLIRDAKNNKYEIDKNQPIDAMGDLELLAHLQHQGAATCLLDMSENPLFALWIACMDERNIDGKVMMLNVAEPQKYKIINHDDLKPETKIERFFEFIENSQGNSQRLIYRWKPAHINQRIIVQQSVFLLGDIANMDDNHIFNIIIDKESKEPILRELDALYGINEQRNFPDFSGFAKLNAHDRPYISETDAETLFQIALEYQQESDWDNALSYYNRAIELNPELTEAYHNRGIVKYKMRKFAEALGDFTQAIKLNPELAETYVNRAHLKGKMGDKKGALQDYDKAIQLNSKDAQAYSNRGVLKANMGDKEGALKDYNRAIELNPNDAIAYSNRGNIENDMGEYSKALKDCNKAIELNPQFAKAYNNRGNAKGFMGELADALEDYDRAIELNPQFVEAYINRGIAKGKLKKFAEALQDFNRAIELKPEYVEAYVSRGSLKGMMDDKEGALKDFKRAIDLNPKFAKAYYGCALVKDKLGDKVGARADFHKAHELDSKFEIPPEYKD